MLDLNNINDFDEMMRTVGNCRFAKTEEMMNSSPLETIIFPNELSNVICVYAIRYLNRKLLGYLVSERCLLKRGSIFAMSHFCKHEIGAPWKFQHPREKHVLERNELNKLFQDSGRWTILQDNICFDDDHGRTMCQFVAEKH